MALKFESLANQDIMDYMLSCSSVPLVGSRNRDRSPFIGEFQMKVSEKLNAQFRAVGIEVECIVGSDDTYPSFIGKIISSGRDEQNKAYDLIIRSELSLLELTNVDYSHLNGLFAAGTAQQYQSSDNELKPSVQAIWAIEVMFTALGLSFALGSGYKDFQIDTYNDGGVERILEYEHLRLDENMLYAINANVSGFHTTIEGDEYSNFRYTYWDFIREYCTYTNSKIELSTTGTKRQYLLKRIDDGSGVGLSDTDIYWKRTERIVGLLSGWNVDHKFNDSRGAYLLGSSAADLTSHVTTNGNEKKNIPITSNFVFMWEAFWDSAGDTLGIGNYPADNWNANQMTENRKNKLANNWLKSVYKTSIGYNEFSRLNEILVAPQQNKITHEALG